jgi:L-malate glycosyltransferase
MTKSIHIIGSRMLGGAESFYMRLINALQQSGDQSIAINRPNSLVAKELSGCVPQYHCKMRNQWDFLSRMVISKVIKQEKPDIVQTYMTRATILTHVSQGKGPVHIARLGGYYNIKRFQHAHAWVGNTKGICDYLVDHGLPADKVFYIGNFVGEVQSSDQTRIFSTRKQYDIESDALVIFALGRLVYKKGFDTLVHAFDQLPGEINGRPLHLIIAGDGPMSEDLQTKTQKLTSRNRIHWAGWQTDASDYFHMADLFVCPSREEPLGNVILEGWAYGKAVVSTRSMGGVELITNKHDGLLVPINHPQEMAKAMQQVLEDDSFRESIAQQGNARVNSQFTQQVIVSQYQDLYQQLLS